MAQQFLELDPIKFKSRPEAGKYRIYLDENTGNLVLVDDALNETPVGGNNITTAAVVAALAAGTEEEKQSVLPQSIEIASMTFDDGSALTLPDGSFTGGSDNLLYRHNNSDAGGLPYAPLPRNTQQNVGGYPNYRISCLVINVNCGSATDFRVLNADGQIDVTFVSDTTGTLNISANVSNGDVNYEWAAKVAAALNADATFSTHYHASAVFGILQCTKKVTGADATLAITLADSSLNPCGMGANLTGSTSVQVAYLELARFSVAASENKNGTQFKLFGTFGVVINAAHSAGGTIYTGIAPATSRNASSSTRGLVASLYHANGGLTSDKVDSSVQSNAVISIVTDVDPRNKVSLVSGYFNESVVESSDFVQFNRFAPILLSTASWNVTKETAFDLVLYAAVPIDQTDTTGTVGYYTNLTLTPA